MLKFDLLCLDLIVTTVVLRFQVLKEKEDQMVENVPTETPSGDHCEGAMEVEVARIASKNLTASSGQGAAKTVAGVAPNGAEQEETAEV
jgi:hypothetical protein